MNGILSTLGRVFSKSILVGLLVGLIGLSGIIILPQQPASATLSIKSHPTATEYKTDGLAKENSAVTNRDEAYEEAVKAVESPQGIEKVYEKDLKVYQKEHPGESLVEKAEEAIEKVTGKE
ncbi:MAG TPA: hypothetical protein VK211_10725 [Kamptonema sp.]|nr:hypothetical protein [Kamptonema sp.]